MNRKLLSVISKKFVILLLVLSATTYARGGTLANQTAVIQKCIDLPELQQYLVENSSNQFVILKHGVDFQENMQISKFGKPVLFLDKLELAAANPEAYIVFYILDVSSDKARIDCTYRRKNGTPENIRFYLEMSLEAGNWVVTKKTIQEK
jgi:hypothetical protein